VQERTPQEGNANTPFYEYLDFLLLRRPVWLEVKGSGDAFCLAVRST
jgi:hypothetical protein